MSMLIPLFVIVPLAGALALQALSVFKRDISDWLANIVMAILFILSLLSLYFTYLSGAFIYRIGGWPSGIGISFVLDSFSALFLTIISFVGSMAAIYSIEYMKRFTDRPKYFTLFLMLICGMNGVVLTGDLFNLYIFMEMASLASYALVAFGCGPEELEASFRYMVMGSVASSFILLAIVLLYVTSGSLNMAQISIISGGAMTAPIQLCFALFLMGFGLKAALVPFHAWIPDAHQSAPSPISAMLSGVLIKTAGIYSLSRIIFNVLGMNPATSNALMAIGAASMIIGVILAIGQWDMKRLFAYHSVSQMGYIVLGLGIGNALGILGALFHLFNHSNFKALLFFNSGAVEYSAHTRDLREMGGLAQKLPVTSATSLAASASIAGVPPFNGFWSKFMIIFAAAVSGHLIYSLIAVIASVLTLASFTKVQRYGFYGALKENLAQVREIPFSMCFPMVLLAAFCLLGGLLFPYVLSFVIGPAAGVLLKGLGYARIVLGG